MTYKPITICWWWFERRRFKTDLTLPSWIAELSFIKDLQFDKLIMLLPLRSLLKFVSLLESSLCGNLRILDKRFPTNIIVPIKFKYRPSLCNCDAEMLLWEMTFVSSCFKMVLYFLSMLFASFLSVRTISDDMTMFLKLGWNLVMVSLKFTNSLNIKSSVLYGLLLLPIWIMILSGYFLR